MNTIWKFELDETSTIDMPEGAKILRVGCQGEKIMLWALVDVTDATRWVQRNFWVYGTGEQILDGRDEAYLGTVFAGPYVWHVFERKG